MNIRNFLKRWLGYSRRERTGSMVLLSILLIVLVIRMAGSGGEDRGVEAEAPPPLAQISRSVPCYGGHGEAEGGDSLKLEADGIPGYSMIEHRQGSAEPELDEYLGTDMEIRASENTSLSPLKGGSDPRQHSESVGLIDLNRADSAELEALPGIGPVLAVRIIKYRYLLGFFYSVDQLNDVYGLDREVIEMNRNRFTCDTLMLRKIAVNNASYGELLRHPYVSERQVEAIVKLRDLSGPVHGISELINNRIFSCDEVERLKPYLEFR